MSYDRELTKQILGDIGPLRFNPKVVPIEWTFVTKEKP